MAREGLPEMVIREPAGFWGRRILGGGNHGSKNPKACRGKGRSPVPLKPEKKGNSNAKGAG